MADGGIRSMPSNAGASQGNHSQRRPPAIVTQRQWKRTPYGAHFHYNRGSQAFVLMSYNILSQDNLEKQPQLYSGHIDYALAWPYRLQCLKREIERVRPTILCLQEVQVTHLDDIVEALRKLNYDRPLFKKRNGEQSDGCAIFYNHHQFRLVDHHFVEFFQPQIDILNRYNVAVMATFALRKESSRTQSAEFCVCTTHLLYNPRRSDIRGAQTQVLLAELDRFACHSETQEPLPIILTGDFNSQPHSDLYRLIVEGEIKKCANYRQLPTQLGITDHCQHHAVAVRNDRKETSLFNSHKPPNIDRNVAKQLTAIAYENYESRKFSDEAISQSGLPFETDSLRHHLNLTSAIVSQGRGSTYHHEWITVDYIFYTKFKRKRSPDAVASEPVHYSPLQLLSYLELPTIAQCCARGPIPDRQLGSDHYSLVAEFVMQFQRT